MTDSTKPSALATLFKSDGYAANFLRGFAAVSLMNAASLGLTGHVADTDTLGVLGVGAGVIGGAVAVKVTEDMVTKLRDPEFRETMGELFGMARSAVGMVGTVLGAYKELHALDREANRRDGAVASWDVQKGWMVRPEGQKTFVPMSDAAFKQFEADVAATGGELNKLVMSGDQMTLMRYVGGKLHGDTPQAPAKITIDVSDWESLNDGTAKLITTTYCRAGSDVTAEVEAELAQAAKARAEIGSRYY